jgi:hypothetical protein
MTVLIESAEEAGICRARFSGTITAADIEDMLQACLQVAERHPVGVLVDFAAEAMAPDVLSWLFHSAAFRALLDHPNVRAWACVVYSMMAWLAVQALAWPTGVEVFGCPDEARAYLREVLSGGAQPSFSGQA